MTATNQIVSARGTGMPLGIVKYNHGSFATMPYAQAAGLSAAHMYVSGGMIGVNLGGSRGWELQVPKTGAYLIEWSQRVDIGGTAAWVYVECDVIYNGSSNSAIGYAIHSGYASADIYHTLNICTVNNLTAGDTVGGYWSSSCSSASTTAYYNGYDNNVNNDFIVMYLGQLTAVF